MYIAEIKGKIPSDFEHKEDILTSNVFSFFNYANRELFLAELLQLLSIKLNKEELENAEFLFWPIYPDGTEPDLVLLAGGYYLLFEAKYTSGFGQETELIRHQLEREYDEGSREAARLSKEFRLIAITCDVYFNNIKYSDIPDFLWEKIEFINWQQITCLLEGILQTKREISSGDFRMMRDLYSLLIKKGLRSFKGFTYGENPYHIQKCPDEVFYDLKTSQYYGKFFGFLERLGSACCVHPSRKYIFLEGTNE